MKKGSYLINDNGFVFWEYNFPDNADEMFKRN